MAAHVEQMIKWLFEFKFFLKKSKLRNAPPQQWVFGACPGRSQYYVFIKHFALFKYINKIIEHR